MIGERIATNADARVYTYIYIVIGDISITIGPLNQNSRAVSVKVEVAVLGFPSLIVLNMVSDCGRKAALNLNH